jgi:hypothetical protein
MAAPRRFLLPVRVLSRRFRRLVLKALAKAYADGALQFFGEIESLRDPSAFARFLAPLSRVNYFFALTTIISPGQRQLPFNS